MIGGVSKEGGSPADTSAAERAHYDDLEPLIALSIGKTKIYSCALFEDRNTDLDVAQIAKVHHSLDKLDTYNGLQGQLEGKTLLDVGFGYGTSLRIAAQDYKIGRGIGLNVSPKQVEFAQRYAVEDSRLDYRLQRWEDFDEPVDAVVSIGAFEHFGKNRHDAPLIYRRYFECMRGILPSGGLMLLHTILIGSIPAGEFRAFAKHLQFLGKDIFPEGYLPTVDQVRDASRGGGFVLLGEEHLGPHYALTLDAWAANLEANRDVAIVVTDPQTYDMFLNRYLRETAKRFRNREYDVCQFLLRAS